MKIFAFFMAIFLVILGIMVNIKAVSKTIISTAPTSTPLSWGAYVGDEPNALADFESLVGKPVNIYADFEGWNNSFPLNLKNNIGKASKTLLIFWEPNFGYDQINDGSKDAYIKKFAEDAKSYGFPIILVPFPEMNLNEMAWGYGINRNDAYKFKRAWMRVYDIFTLSNVKNVKFGIAYNNVSIPNIAGNQYDDYYPGSMFVDYVGVDGFNFGNPNQSFEEIFDGPMEKLKKYNKPIYIFSTASVAGPQKAAWISSGLGSKVKSYAYLKGWVWFNQGGDPNWLINSDENSLRAFKSVIPLRSVTSTIK